MLLLVSVTEVSVSFRASRNIHLSSGLTIVAGLNGQWRSQVVDWHHADRLKACGMAEEAVS